MDVEQELMTIDFCRFNKVQDSLLEYLLNIRRQTKDNDELDLNELDMVAAAGYIHPKNNLTV